MEPALVLCADPWDGSKENISTCNPMSEYLESKLGPKRKELPVVILLLVIYVLIFISGTVGNVCTCVVILRNNYMKTTTNYYLLSLAISDVLILLIGLPSEAYSIWESYPWRFGKAFCIIKSLCGEMTSYASVLTITAFTIERYIAICQPLKAHKIATSRCIKIIIAIWIISLFCALPYPVHTDLFFYARDRNNSPIADSLQCNIPPYYSNRMMHVFQLSTFVFFVFPLTVIIVLYSLIGLALRKADLRRTASDERYQSCRQGNNRHHSDRSPTSIPTKSVLRVLVAVVVAFFLCWAPFHAQRLWTIYNTHWNPRLLAVQSTVFYISGVLYFVGSTVNPILYNVMSRRYRLAFRETICNIPNSPLTGIGVRASSKTGTCPRRRSDEQELRLLRHVGDTRQPERFYLNKLRSCSVDRRAILEAELRHVTNCSGRSGTGGISVGLNGHCKPRHAGRSSLNMNGFLRCVARKKERPDQFTSSIGHTVPLENTHAHENRLCGDFCQGDDVVRNSVTLKNVV